MNRFLMIIFCIIVASSAWAQVPQLVTYQGLLTDTSGSPITDLVSMEFSIYDDSSGGNLIWSETHSSVSVLNGYFTVLLGGINPLGDSVFTESDRYLGIAVDGDPETQPRARISAAPYANNAGSVINASGGSVLLVGSAADSVQIDPFSGHAFRMTDSSGEERMAINAHDEEGPTLTIKNPNGRYITLSSGDSTICIYGMDGNMRVKIGMEAGSRIDGGGAVSVYDDSLRLSVSVTKDGVAIFDNSRSDTVAFFSTDGNIIGKGRISMGTDSLNGPWSAVFGQHSSGQGTGSTVSGGINNYAVGDASTIGGGTSNSNFGYGSTVGGGRNNHADSLSDYSLVAGGRAISIFAGPYSTISGGYLNMSSGEGTTIGGGFADTVFGTYSMIGGGNHNTISGSFNALGGGQHNAIDAGFGVIGGGYSNTAGDGAADSAVCIGGGSDNSITEKFSFIGGGYNNSVAGEHSSILGGRANTVTNLTSVVCGGNSNQANGISSAVGGGYSNIAGGARSFVGGGGSNQATGDYSCVSGGRLNEANGNYSKAGGRRAFANHDGVFIWADQRNFDFESNAAGEFAARSTGGVRFVTAIDSSGNPLVGVRVVAGGGSWQSLCDRNAKENITPVNEEELLGKIAVLPISSWNYKSQPNSIRHIGPMAQDFNEIFNYGEDDLHITTVDADGISLASIKALYKNQQELQKQVAQLQHIIDELLKNENIN